MSADGKEKKEKGGLFSKTTKHRSGSRKKWDRTTKKKDHMIADQKTKKQLLSREERLTDENDDVLGDWECNR